MKETSTIHSCYHCGNDCDDGIITLHEKEFCCEGCKTVYEIISFNQLDSYYKIEEKAPGISLRNKTASSKFDFLDDEITINQLLDFKEEELSKITLLIPQIHCNSCIWLLEHLYKFDEGVKQSKVNFIKRELTLSFNNEQTTLKKLFVLLDSLGYTPKVNLANTEQKKIRKNNRINYQLGITGFCFGNIMLLSFPEYLDNGEALEEGFKQYFGYINLLIALPVLFFGAIDYLKSAWAGLKNNIINIDIPISLGIVAIFAVSATEILTKTGAGYLDSLAGLIFFLLLGRIFQGKTYEHLSFERDYKSYFPIAVTKVENEKEINIPLKKLLAGDRVLVKNQELIPADAMLLTSDAAIDYSFVTGESKEIKKVAGEIVYAGGKNTGGAILIETTKRPTQSYLIKLWEEKIQKDDAGKNLSDISNNMAKYFTMAIIAIAVSAAVYWLRYDTKIAIHAFTSVLIIACPCALALTIPFVFGNTMRVFAKYGFFVKNAQVIENMSKTTQLVFDKTGTLTTNSSNSVHYVGDALSSEEKQWVKSVLVNSSHPLSKKVAQTIQGAPLPVSDFQELSGKGLTAVVDSQKIRVGSAAFIVGETATQHTTAVYVEIEGSYKGHYQITNEYRKGIKQLAQKLGAFKSMILSGDSDGERATLHAFFGEKTEMYFNQSPYDKLEQINKLKENGQHVLMLGDGLNDSGALSASTVGVAVTEDTSFFTPASDVIMDAKELPKLHAYLNASKLAKKLVYGGFRISFLYNIVGLSFAVQGLLSPIVAAILMPLSSITIVLYATLASNWSINHLLKKDIQVEI